MTSLFTTGTQGTPIAILQSDQFPRWLENQSPHTKTWITASGYQGQGLCLIPNSEGQLSQVVYGVDDINHHFACGDLVSQLPEGEFRIEGDDDLIKRTALAWGVGAYRFQRYKNGNDPMPTLVLPNEPLKVSTEREVNAVNLVRDLINTPAQDMMPEHLGDFVASLAETFGADVEQIIGDDLLTHNYPTIHAVGRASEHAPRLIDLRWCHKRGEKSDEENLPKITLVGKGVCFDSGGLDVKNADGMRNMKKDMGGAAHAIALAQLIMAHQLPVRLRLLIPAVENAIAHNAYRPGDVIKTRKGLTVEIHNTDAEGRLVLCDALAEADTESPDLLIDFATLTGSCRVALGTELAGLFSNRKDLATKLCEAGEAINDPVCSLPLHAPYRDFLNSDIADLVNCPSSPKGAAIVAALYLESFISDSTPWCHFDIMAWNTRALPGRPVGGEAMGLRAVFEYLVATYG